MIDTLTTLLFGFSRSDSDDLGDSSQRLLMGILLLLGLLFALF